MNIDPASPGHGPVFSAEPNPERPSVPAAVAARHFQKSRYYITELIKQGEIEGYGIQREKNGRTRWYVFKDVLPHESDQENSDPSTYWHSMLENVLDARELSRRCREARAHADALFLEVMSLVQDAAQAVNAGDGQLMHELVQSALAKQMEGARHQMKANEVERKVEACIDIVIRGFTSQQEP